MKEINVTLGVKFKWWLKYYLMATMLFCKVAGKFVSEDKINKITKYVISSGMTVK